MCVELLRVSLWLESEVLIETIAGQHFEHVEDSLKAPWKHTYRRKKTLKDSSRLQQTIQYFLSINSLLDETKI